ncbi:MAG: hypothetical protein MHPSP_003279, partial [Paramarteilia canceri]
MDRFFPHKRYKAKYFYNSYNRIYVECRNGKANEILPTEVANSCTGCSIYYRYQIYSNGFRCIECPRNTIASTKTGHKEKYCNISHDNFESTEILENEKKTNCNNHVENSIGRESNTPPILDYCQCPNNMARVFQRAPNDSSKKYRCISKELALKITDRTALDYAVINNVFTPKEKIFFYYKNCDPFRDYYSYHLDNYICLCPPKQIYSDGKCKYCTDSEIIDPENQIKCINCSNGKILTLDGKGCMCPYSDEPQSKDCNEATQNKKFCSGNLGLKNGKCKPCIGNKLKSKITGECVCPDGEYISSDNDCNVCSNGFTEMKTDEIHCVCQKGKYINSNDKCVNCADGYTTIEINQTKCFCSDGKFIDSYNMCIDCPSGKFINYNNICVDCINGLTTNATNQKTCFCPEGKFINYSNICVDCINGLTTKEINQTSCICPEGKYLYYGTNECYDCPHGYTSFGINQTNCLCPSGKFIGDRYICFDCPRGYTSFGINQTNCICTPGKFIDDNYDCVDCIYGYTTIGINQTNCICSEDRFINSEGKCVDCPAGKFINSENVCIDCIDGLTTKETNQTSCICPEGKFINSRTNECVDCTDGLITKEINETSCICPEGKFINSDSICVDCTVGTFSTSIDSKKCNKCPFFKTTNTTKSNSMKLCNKVDSVMLAAIIITITIISG